MKLFTLGTDHRKSFDFTRLLLKYGIEVVFDVRRMPEAQEEYFRRGPLQALVSAQGVDYIYLGNELGAPLTGTAQWLSSDEFRRGIDIIRNKASKRACCILCIERTPVHCHRLAIADELKKAGFEVIHILDETSTWTPPPPVARPPRPPQFERRRFGHGRPPRRRDNRGRPR